MNIRPGSCAELSMTMPHVCVPIYTTAPPIIAIIIIIRIMII